MRAKLQRINPGESRLLSVPTYFLVIRSPDGGIGRRQEEPLCGNHDERTQWNLHLVSLDARN
jgi:hypothetical protein